MLYQKSSNPALSVWLNLNVRFPDAEFHNLLINWLSLDCVENYSRYSLTVAEQTLCGMYTPSESHYIITIPIWLIFKPMDIIASQSSITSPFYSLLHRIDRANPLFTI